MIGCTRRAMRRFRLGSVFSIPIELDITFLLIIPIFAYLIGSQVVPTANLLNTVWDAQIAPQALASGSTPWILGTIAALGLFVGVVLHELGHSLVALHFGYAIESITLWILGGIASITDMPEDWRQELLIAVAGPFVSILLGVGCYLIFLVLPETFYAGRFVLGYLAILNVALAAFNLLPGFPMDGGRVLRALLARTRSHRRATQIAVTVGKGFALFLGFIGLLGFNIILIGIALFIYVGASSEMQQQLLEDAFKGVSVRKIMTPAEDLDTVASETSISELLEQMFRQRHVGYPVVDDGTVVGMITLDDISSVPPVERDAITAADMMETNLKTISTTADIIDALSELQRNKIGRLLVMDTDDELTGMITRTDLTRALSIANQIESTDYGNRGQRNS